MSCLVVEVDESATAVVVDKVVEYDIVLMSSVEEHWWNELLESVDVGHGQKSVERDSTFMVSVVAVTLEICAYLLYNRPYYIVVHECTCCSLYYIIIW